MERLTDEASIDSRSAISALERPSETSSAILSSRGGSTEKRSEADSARLGITRAMSSRVTRGESTASPAATERIAPTIAPTAESLSRNPDAPTASAPNA